MYKILEKGHSDVLECILNLLTLAEIRRLQGTNQFFRHYDYTQQYRRIANESLAQANSTVDETLRQKLTFKAACLGNLPAILTTWQTQLQLAVDYANTTHTKFKSAPRQASLEKWAKIAHPFIFISVMGYKKAQLLQDKKGLLLAAYRSSILFNSDRKFQTDARRYCAAIQQDPSHYITSLLVDAEKQVDDKIRTEVQHEISSRQLGHS